MPALIGARRQAITLNKGVSGLDLDFANGRYALNSGYRSSPADIPGWSFSRTGAGTALDLAGNVINFPARTNLLLRSQEFDNASWGKVASTATANAGTSPDGSTTADKLTPAATLGQHRLDQTPSSTAGAQTLSVFAKPDGYNFIAMRIGPTGVQSIFDVSTGTITQINPEAGVTVSISSAANGFYRCTITVASASANDIARINALPTASFADYTGDGTSGVLLWGAQLETGSVATDYIATTTAAATAPSLPRITNRGLLVEEARTNGLLWSQEFDNATWVKTASTVSANVVNAPDGTATGDTLFPAATTAAHYLESSTAYNVTTGQTHVFSVFAKNAGQRYLSVGLSTSIFGAGNYVCFDLQSGVVTSSTGLTGSIVAAADGWYRCAATATATGTGVNLLFLVLSDGTASRAPSFSGNISNGVSIWGAQLELGSFATSPIITTGAAATRGTELPIETISPTTPWTLTATVRFSGDAANNQGIVSMGDGTTSNRITFFRVSSTQVVSLSVRSAGSFVGVGTVSSAARAGARVVKVAVSFDGTTYRSAVDGVLNSTITGGAVAVLNRINPGWSCDATSYCNDYVGQNRLLPYAATDAQLQALTS